MAEQPENQPISDEERATWVREQFQKANKFLAEMACCLILLLPKKVVI